MLFKVTKDGDFFKDNPSALSIPEFEDCDSKQMKYICLVYDYKSPLRQMKVDPRKDKAIELAGYPVSFTGKHKLKDNSIKKVSRAIRGLLSIQYDSDRETLKAYDEQMEQYRRFMKQKDKSAAELKLSVSIMEKIVELESKRKDLIELLELRDGSNIELDEDLEGASEMVSALDERNMNQS